MRVVAQSLLLAVILTSTVQAGAPRLRPPRTRVGMSVEEALSLRRSTKSFATRSIPISHLSQLLWAANGKNRPDGKRTVPSALACYGISVYLATRNGVFRYQTASHSLATVATRDFRSDLLKQEPYKSAPAILLLVADLSVFPERFPKALRERFAATEAGFVGQSVYLQCAALDLGCVFVAGVMAEAAGKILRLETDQSLMYAMPIGYPK